MALKARRKRRSACINMTDTDRRCVTSLSVVDVARQSLVFLKSNKLSNISHI